LNGIGGESPKLRPVLNAIRARVPFLDRDRYLAPDIAAAKSMVQSDMFRNIVGSGLVPSMTQ